MASIEDCSSVTLDFIACECGINFHDEKEFKEHLLNEHIKNDPDEVINDSEDFYVLEILDDNESNFNNASENKSLSLPENFNPGTNEVPKDLLQEYDEKIKSEWKEETSMEETTVECYEVATIPNEVDWNFSIKSETSQYVKGICSEPTDSTNMESVTDTVRLITIQADYDQQLEPSLNFVDEIASEIVLEDNSSYIEDDKEVKKIPFKEDAVGYPGNVSLLPAQYVIAENNNLKFCKLCSLMYVTERSYQMHYRKVHLKIQKKYKKYPRKPLDKMCEVCGKGFSSNALLSYHQRTHTGERPFKCTYCEKAFSMLLRLQIHIRTHTGERPYKCQLCPKAFPNKAAINRHNRVHTGEKPYPCPECGRAFSQSNSMKWHVRTVHWNEPWPYKKKKKIPQYAA